MQYNILINQKSVVDNNLLDKLDLVDLALFDFVYHFITGEFKDKLTFIVDGVEYVEIQVSLISKQMPILGINSRFTLIKRMKKLVEVGLLCRYEDNARVHRSGYRKGKNFSIFVFDKEEHKKDKHDERECEQNEQGVDNNALKSVRASTISVDDGTHNHNNKDNIDNNNHNKEVDDKSSTKKKRKKEVVNDFDFRQTLLDAGADSYDVDEWMRIRKKNKNSLYAYGKFLDEVKKAGISIKEAVSFSCENGWQGFKAEWYNKNNNYGYEKRGIRGSNKVIFEPTDSNEHGTDKRPF